MAERAALLAAAALALAACGDDGTASATDGTAAPASTGEAPSTGAPGPTETGGPDPTGTGGPGESSSGGTAAATGEPGSTGMSQEPPEGVFIAVGDGGRRARSTDAATWDTIVGTGEIDVDAETAPPDGLRDVAVGDGVVLAVGGGGNVFKSNAMIMRSADGGVTWEEDLLAGAMEFEPRRLFGVAYSEGVFVAAGQNAKVIRSADAGTTWTDHTFDDFSARLLAVAGLGQTFVVVGWTEDAYDAPKTSFIYTSADAGMTWAPPDEGFARLDDVAAGNGAFVAVGSTTCIRSTDGMTWAECGLLAPSYQGVAFVRGEFVASVDGGLSTSADGMTWSTPVLPALGAPARLAYGNGRWAGVRWTERGFSEDLEAWTFETFATEPMRAIVFVPDE